MSGSSNRTDADVRAAIYVVRAASQTGTGFLVGDQSHILTARHVVTGILAGGGHVVVLAAGGRSRSAEVESVIDGTDAVLLRLSEPVPREEATPFALAPTALPAGTSFSVYGYPVAYTGGQWVYGVLGNEEADGEVTVIFSVAFDPATYGDSLEGLSGAPVFDMRDRDSVIGIMTRHGPVNYQLGRVLPAAELGRRFGAGTAGLVAALRPAAPPPPPQPLSRGNWSDVPEVRNFFGRDGELSLMHSWLLADRVRLIGVLGMAGIGKTSLSAGLGGGGIGKTNLSLQAVKDVQSAFDVIVWRRLLNAPPVTEVIVDIVQQLTARLPRPYADTRRAPIDDLLVLLGESRVLIVLDNYESVLQGGEDAGGYRAGYEDYGELLERAATGRHSSCIVVTSRETPPELSHHGSSTGPVRCLRLGGLGQSEAEQIFETVGQFIASADDWRCVNDLYQGNPLALELAARHIRDVFDGRVADFLRHGQPNFRALRDLLDWHVERCSDRQQDVLYWLALSREPRSISDLQASSTIRSLEDAVQGLSRAIPLEHGLNGLSLQPVLIEHLSARFTRLAAVEIAHGECRLLDRYSTIDARAKDYVRDAQRRLILGELVSTLRESLSREQIAERLRDVLADATQADRPGGYGAGNVVNLASHLGLPLRQFDLSHRYLRSADLQGRVARDFSVVGATIDNCSFTEAFSGVLSLAFSDDGHRLAASTDSGELRVWGVPELNLKLAVKAHTDWAWAVLFSPDGERVITGGSDGTIRVWGAQYGEQLATLTGHESEVRCLAISRDGSTLASGSQDRTIRLWDLASYKCLAELRGHDHDVRGVAFHPDGSLLASCSRGQTVRLWSMNTHECEAVLQGHRDMVRSVSFDRSGERLVSGANDGTIRVWDLSRRTEIASLGGEAGWVLRTAFSPVADSLASLTADGTVRFWDYITGECVKTVTAHPSVTNTEAGLCFSQDGRLIATARQDQVVKLWDVASGDCLRSTEGYTNPFYSCTFTFDRRHLLGGSEDGEVTAWDVDATAPIASLHGHYGAVWTIAASMIGPMIVTGATDRQIRLWDLETGECRKVLGSHDDRVNGVAFSPDSMTVASASADETVRIWSVHGSVPTILRGHDDAVWSVAFDPTGNLLASGGEDGTICFWSVIDAELLMRISAEGERLYSIAFSPDGRRVVSSGGTGVVAVWDVEGGGLITRWEGHHGRVRTICFHPDGNRVFTAGVDGLIRAWDLSTRQCLATLSGHEDIIWQITADRSGEQILSASHDGTVRLWDLKSGRGVHTYRGLRPYEEMDITGTRGLSATQISSLVKLGAVHRPDALRQSLRANTPTP
jgi:WD40 repeat protein